MKLRFRTKILSILILVISTAIPPVVNSSSGLDNWTVIYYICGDSNISDFVPPLTENLSRIGSTKGFNLIVFEDQPGVGDFHLYYVDEYGEFVELNDILGWPDEVDCGNNYTLYRLLVEMMRIYPARHYALIPFASGGTGWQRFCLPDRHPPTKQMTLPVLASTLREVVNRTHHKLDVLFGSCASGVIELAYEVAPYVDYLVLTQDCLSREHLVERFYQATWDIKNNSNLTPEEFGKQAVSHLKPLAFYYPESYYNKTLSWWQKLLNKLPFSGLHTVLFYDSTAVINSSNIDELVESINSLAEYLINHLTMDMKETLRMARRETREYGRCNAKFYLLEPVYRNIYLDFMAYDCFIDIQDFVEHLRDKTRDKSLKDLCSKVISKLNNVIPYFKGVKGDSSHGLSIYFPQEKILYNKNIFPYPLPESNRYEKLRLSQDTLWDEFLRCYLGVEGCWV